MSNSTALVPFEQLERMAVTVAKSGLFGMRTPEQALALMLLAQAEGVPAIIGVRDYHISKDGRPMMKADTMLARFQETGGVVKWHCLTDDKADATFTHPNSPEPLRIDWDKARAERAGLAGKDTWRGYPRAMLRSRLISEGVRTCYPACVAGKYTPEEVLTIDGDAPALPPTPVPAADLPMTQEIADGHMSAISNAANPDVLKRAYAEAYRAARDDNDEQRMKSFVLAYTARKDELEQPV